MFSPLMPPMMPMGQLCYLNSPGQPFTPFPMQSMGGMPFGMPISDDNQQEFAKSCLNSQKQQLMQAKKCLDEYNKMIDESISAIDSQLSKISKTEAEAKKPGK